MKFVLINQFYVPDLAPTGTYLHDLAKQLVSEGHQVRVICSRRNYDGGGDHPAREIIDGVLVIRVRALGFGRTSYVGKIADYASFYFLCALELIRDSRSQIFIALTTPPWIGLLARWAALLHGVRHAHWIMDLYPDILTAHFGGKKLRFFAIMTRREIRGSLVTIALGDQMSERVDKYRSGTSAIVGIPLWSATEIRLKENTPSVARANIHQADGLILMYSGNMGLGHRFGEFLEAAAQLGECGPTWVFAGGGKRAAQIMSFAAAHPEARIVMKPYAPHDQLREHLRSADIHLVSLDDAWQGCMVPSKIQAIFAVARPVIFVGGNDNEIAQWIRDAGAGWVVPSGDVPALIRAVEEAGDPSQRAQRGAAAHAFAQRHFDRDTNLRALAALLTGGAARYRGRTALPGTIAPDERVGSAKAQRIH